MALSTYGNATDTDGAVRMIMDLRRNIAGQHVLIVEDIVDTGYTLAYLVRTLAARQPASLKTCVLVHKPDRREVYAQIDYLGFEIPDEWVVGCGLDWAEKYPDAAVYRGREAGGVSRSPFAPSASAGMVQFRISDFGFRIFYQPFGLQGPRAETRGLRSGMRLL